LQYSIFDGLHADILRVLHDSCHGSSREIQTLTFRKPMTIEKLLEPTYFVSARLIGT
jgi:hypothetical protein